MAGTGKRQAKTLRELNEIRHSKLETLDRWQRESGRLGTALGYRLKRNQDNGKIEIREDCPAILFFVKRKLTESQLRALNRPCVEPTLSTDQGLWCDVDVVEEIGPNTWNFDVMQTHSRLTSRLRGCEDRRLTAKPRLYLGSKIDTLNTSGSIGPFVFNPDTQRYGFITAGHVCPPPHTTVKSPAPAEEKLGYFFEGRRNVFWSTIYGSEEPGPKIGTILDYAHVEFEGYGRELFDVTLPTDCNMSLSNDAALTSDVKQIDQDVDLTQSIINTRVAKIGHTTGLTFGHVAGFAFRYLMEGSQTQ